MSADRWIRGYLCGNELQLDDTMMMSVSSTQDQLDVERTDHIEDSLDSQLPNG